MESLSWNRKRGKSDHVMCVRLSTVQRPPSKRKISKKTVLYVIHNSTVVTFLLLFQNSWGTFSWIRDSASTRFS